MINLYTQFIYAMHDKKSSSRVWQSGPVYAVGHEMQVYPLTWSTQTSWHEQLAHSFISVNEFDH